MQQISPGGEADINVKLSTRGYGGRRVSEKIDIYTNDPQQRMLSVVVTGQVEKYATIEPRRAILTGKPGTPIEARITITPEPKYTFKITNTRVRDGKNINFRLEENQQAGQLSYTLIVENLQQEHGRYADMIYLETDNNSLPTLQVYVTGNILRP